MNIEAMLNTIFHTPHGPEPVPTQTPEIALRDRQESLWMCWLAAECEGNLREAKRLKDIYEGNIAQVKGSATGIHMHVCYVDPEMWSLYSDLHKDVHNFRPRFFVNIFGIMPAIEALDHAMETSHG